MAKTNPMICADCGVTMNHHAMKIDPRIEQTDGDPLLGGALMEAHTCPGCGRTDLRAA